MKDIYVNKDGIICACTVPFPNEKDFSGDQWKENNALQSCKESAVPFDEQDHAFHALYLQTKTDYKINATFSEWFNNFPKPDTFYQIDCDWEIVEVPEEDSGTDEIGRKVDFKKVARLKVTAPTVATDNSGENFEKEKKEAKEWELWRDFLYEVGKQRHYLHGEVWEDTEWEKLMEILKKDFIITRKS